MTHICVGTNHHRFRWWLFTWTAPSHYLNQCWNIVNWALANKFQRNFHRNFIIFNLKNASEIVVWQNGGHFVRGKWVNGCNNGISKLRNCMTPVKPHRADFRFAPSQWETSLQSNAVSHWLGANLESPLPRIWSLPFGCCYCLVPNMVLAYGIYTRISANAMMILVIQALSVVSQRNEI